MAPSDQLIRPPRLRPGDRVEAVSPSAGLAHLFPHRYEVGVAQMEAELGVRVTASEHALASPEFLAAHPEARAADLNRAFGDPEVRAIVATVGGDDSVRILPHLDLEAIRANPKIVLGFSDVTAVHFACRRAGLATFSGPVLMGAFAENGGMHAYALESLRRTLFDAAPPGVVEPNPSGWTEEFLDWADPSNQERRRALQPAEPWRFLQGRGTTSGPLLGGCLEVLEFLKGTEWWLSPDEWAGAVLFLETSEEAPSPTWVRRWLRNYGSQGILQSASAVLFGRPGGNVGVNRFAEYDDAVLGVVRDELGLTELPVVTRMDFGHTAPIFTIPYGARATVDAAARTFSIDEACVR